MKESRKYQTAIENDIPRHLAMHGSTIVQSPTGTGKSHIINKTVQRIMAAGKTPLVQSHSIKIHQQLVVECNGHIIDSGIKFRHILPGHCYVAMTQTLIRREVMLEQFRELADNLVMINDECHIATMNPVIDALKPRWMIGFSATPHYKWAKHLPKYYRSLIHGPQINQLIEDGYLAHYRHVIRTGANLTELKLRAGEYTEESQNEVFGSKRMYDGLFDDLPEYKSKKTVIYVASIELCEQVYQQCLDRGYKACRYHSGLQDGAWELSKFTERDECDVCVSVSALTLGWDYPPIDLIVLWRATGSLPLYLQICGRGSRICPGKDNFTVLDYGGNYERFGAWCMDRDWNALWQEPPKKRTTSTYLGVAGSKECPICHWLLPVAARSCDNCGYMYPADEMRLVEGQLLEVQNTLNKLNGRQIGDMTAAELALYAKAKDKKMHAIRVAKRMEQEQPGFLKQFAAEMGYKPSWVNRMLESLPEDHKITFYNSKVKI